MTQAAVEPESRSRGSACRHPSEGRTGRTGDGSDGADRRGIAIVGVFAYAESLKVEVMFHQFGLDERAGGIGA